MPSVHVVREPVRGIPYCSLVGVYVCTAGKLCVSISSGDGRYRSFRGANKYRLLKDKKEGRIPSVVIIEVTKRPEENSHSSIKFRGYFFPMQSQSRTSRQTNRRTKHHVPEREGSDLTAVGDSNALASLKVCAPARQPRGDFFTSLRRRRTCRGNSFTFSAEAQQ